MPAPTTPPAQAGSPSAQHNAGALLWRADQLARPSQPGQPSGYAALDAELPGAGWPPGGLTELLLDGQGQGELRLLAPALAQLSHSGRPLVWIGCGGARPSAPALLAWGIDLRQLLWVDAANTPDAAWAAEQALRAASSAASPDAGGAVLCWAELNAGPLQHSSLRRLHLAAQGSASLLFLLRPRATAQQSSPACLRLTCQPVALTPHLLRVQLLKRRGPLVERPLILDTSPLLSAALTLRLSALSRPHAPPSRSPQPAVVVLAPA